LDAVDRNFTLAGGIRACHKGGWSFVTFNGLAQLNDRIAEAVSQRIWSVKNYYVSPS
jgi:TldD protein